MIEKFFEWLIEISEILVEICLEIFQIFLDSN